MTQWPYDSLKDYEEIFQMSYRREHNDTLDLDSLKLVLILGIKEELMETFNMLTNRNIYFLNYEEIKIVFKNHSRAIKKGGRSR